MRALLTVLMALLLTACTGGAPRDASFIVPEGASVARAAQIMEEAGAVESASAFVRHARLFGSDTSIKPGEYEVEAGATNADVLALLQSGRTKQRFIMIPEGMPSVMVRDRLMANPNLTGDLPVPAEGSILPDTYAIAKNEPRAAVVARMQAAMTSALAELWRERGARAAVTSPREAVILASVIEKETGQRSERPMVSGVLSNRLRIGMMLGADATSIYPITRGRPLGRMIRVSELRDPNPYNTRAISGLPIGPITNPGRAAIAAALNPAQTDALYYVADGSGGHVFSRTYEEHKANAARWRAIRAERGI